MIMIDNREKIWKPHPHHPHCNRFKSLLWFSFRIFRLFIELFDFNFMLQNLKRLSFAFIYGLSIYNLASGFFFLKKIESNWGPSFVLVLVLSASIVLVCDSSHNHKTTPLIERERERELEVNQWTKKKESFLSKLLDFCRAIKLTTCHPWLRSIWNKIPFIFSFLTRCLGLCC